MAALHSNSPDAQIPVILGHGNPLVLSAMSEAFLASPRFSLVATTGTAEGFLATMGRTSAIVGVIDWNLPIIGGARLLEVAREQRDAPRIVIYGDPNSSLPRLALSGGAAGFASQSGSETDLLKVCTEVAEGKMVFPFIDIRSLQDNPLNTLSKRERTILEALSNGLTNQELAQDLGIAVNTVKFHLSNLYDKLGVKNRIQAVSAYYKLDHPVR